MTLVLAKTSTLFFHLRDPEDPKMTKKIMATIHIFVLYHKWNKIL